MSTLPNNSGLSATNALVPAAAFSPIAATSGIESVISKASFFAEASRAASSRRATASDFRHFENWCRRHGLPSLPTAPEVVGLYLADNAETLAVASLERRLISITRVHQDAGIAGLSPASTRHPSVGRVMKGIRRTKGVAVRNAKTPVLNPEIRRITAVFAQSGGLRQIRDAAIVLTGYCGAFRRSELAGLRLGSVEWVDWTDATDGPDGDRGPDGVPGGMLLHVGRSKNDQEGVGRKVKIPASASAETCAVRALRRWIEAAGLTDAKGPLFCAISQTGKLSGRPMNPASINYILKRGLRRAGLDDAPYGAHSLRSGFCTQAHAGGGGRGASDAEIMAQTGHRRRKSLDRYIRPGGGENAVAKLGL